MSIALVANARKKAPVTLNAGDDEISLGFPLLAASEVVVTRTRAGVTTTLQLDTHYSVSNLNAVPGALVTLSPVAEQDDVYEAWGVTEISRETVFANGGAYNPDQHNAEAERRILVEQEMRRDVDRALLEPMDGGDYEAGDRKITGLADPEDDQDAATKAWVVEQIAGGVEGDLAGLVEDAEAAQAGAQAAQTAAETARDEAVTAKDLAEAVAAGYADATVYGFGVVEVADAAALQAYAELEIGVDVQAYDADTLKADETDTLTAGFALTTYDAGTKSTGTFTPNEANGNMQRCVNGGAFTLAPPTNDGNIILKITNSASAGAITTSGFTKVSGDALTTTNGHIFIASIVKCAGHSLLNVAALQ